LGNKLLLLLNFCDLMVCFTALSASILIHIANQNGNDATRVSYLVSVFIYMVFFDCTGFATCLISVTRTIKVCRPFFDIRGVWTGVSFLIFFLCSFTREFTCYYLFYIKPLQDPEVVTDYYPLIVSSGIIASVLAVFSSTVVTTYWLLRKSKVKGKVSENSIHATVTILILSAVFCTLNFIFVTTAVLSFSVKLELINISQSLIKHVKDVTSSLTIAFNSAVNPLIYILRKQEMRQHFVKMSRKIKNSLGSHKTTDVSIKLRQYPCRRHLTSESPKVSPILLRRWLGR
jgi:hypothetical protein